MSTQSLVFTDSAATKVAALIQEEGNPNLKFRAYLEGGGCSGFKYGFTFDEQVNPDDFVIEKTIQLPGTNEDFKVQLLINAASYPYLKNAEIDYQKTFQSEEFVIRNPKAKTTCGCGSSFSVDDSEL